MLSCIEDFSFTKNYINVEIVKDSFSAFELTKSENFISLLYYLGLVTIDSEEMGDVKLTIPNQTIRRIMAEFVNTMFDETNTLNLNIQHLSDLIYDLAFDDNLELFKFFSIS